MVQVSEIVLREMTVVRVTTTRVVGVLMINRMEEVQAALGLEPQSEIGHKQEYKGAR